MVPFVVALFPGYAIDSTACDPSNKCYSRVYTGATDSSSLLRVASSTSSSTRPLTCVHTTHGRSPATRVVQRVYVLVHRIVPACMY